MLPPARVAMEFCWLYPWIVVLGGGFYGATGPVLSRGWAFVLLVGAQVAVRPVLDRGIPLPRARAVLVGVGLGLGLLAVHAQHYAVIPLWSPTWVASLLQAAHETLPAVPKPVAGALAAALLWWRGLVLGARAASAIEVEQAYRTGVGMVVLYVVAAAIYGDTQAFQAAGPALPGLLPAFFFLGLSVLALMRLAVIWDRIRPDERTHFPARVWLLLVIGVVGVILLAAGAAAGLAAADVSTYLGLALSPLLPVVEILFLVLFVVAGILVRLLIAVLSRLPYREMPDLQTPPTVFDDLLRRLRELEMNPQMVEGARWGMVALVVLLLVIAMALTIVLMRRREGSPDEDQRESVWSARELLRGLTGVLPRIGRPRPPAEDRAGPTAGTIRRIYRELLRLGGTQGTPRPSWMTPREHEPRLRGVFTRAAEDVGVLTAAYERVRYGGARPTAAEVRAAGEALERIKASLAPGPGAAG
ncbi:MAG: DUF4129 domain-containing protein [Armatimonadota bacterium]|nr:DUF4129 domain-containing protein [Armatimonadota bacterium]